MQTMHPVIVSGRHALDAAVFPGDEFEDRVREARESMDSRELDGLVVYGNGEHSAALTYLTNLAPRMRWALAFVPRHGEVQLVVAGPERDLHFSSPTTWVKNLQPYERLDQVARSWADALRASAGRQRLRLGIAGAMHVRQHVLDDMTRCVGHEADAWVDLDADLQGRMETLRPREVRVLRNNLSRLHGITELARKVFTDGGKAADAVRAAEKACLLDGAHEARTLFSRDGGLTLQPFERVEPESSRVFAGYIARRELAYWSEALVSQNVPAEHARLIRDALSRMVAAVKAGAGVGDLERLRVSAGTEQHPFTVRGVAQLGLAIREKSADDVLQAGGVYSLRAGLVFPDGTGAIGSVTVLVHDASAEVLFESHPES